MLLLDWPPPHHLWIGPIAASARANMPAEILELGLEAAYP
jgi:hypothetical protein